MFLIQSSTVLTHQGQFKEGIKHIISVAGQSVGELSSQNSSVEVSFCPIKFVVKIPNFEQPCYCRSI